MKIIAYGKINTYLEIKGVVEHGYHIIDTVMNSISICDEITMDKTIGKCSVSMFRDDGTEFFIERKKNTVWKAVDLFFRTFIDKTSGYGVKISVKKGIPEGAGLGGSSADPAAILRGLGEIFGVSYDEYSVLAPKIGSDVMFMLRGGMARVTSTGDIISPLPPKKLYGVIVKPGEGVNTALCYAEYDKMKAENENIFIGKEREFCGKILNFEAALGGGIEGLIFNALSLPAMKLNNDIREIYLELANEDNAIAVMMTGSGSAVFAITENEKDARALICRIPEQYYSSMLETVESGSTIL